MSVVRREDVRLELLARDIARHHQAITGYARAALVQVLACGEKLCEAREMVPDGHWRAWLRENCGLEKGTAAMYQRLHLYRQELAAAGITTVQAARDHVKENGLRLEVGCNQQHPEEIVFRIFELRGEGLSHRRIAAELGIGKTGVARILNGERHVPKAEPPCRPRKRRRISIEDDMIEGLAEWLVERGYFDEVTDDARDAAVEGLQTALGLRRPRQALRVA